MQHGMFQITTELKQAFVRGMTVFCLATTLAVSVGFLQEAQPVSAATSRQDRRPDRERSVGTSSASDGSSQNSSSSSHSRPRLVRR